MRIILVLPEIIVAKKTVILRLFNGYIDGT